MNHKLNLPKLYFDIFLFFLQQPSVQVCRWLMQGDLLLVPYDCDFNHGPCLGIYKSNNDFTDCPCCYNSFKKRSNILKYRIYYGKSFLHGIEEENSFHNCQNYNVLYFSAEGRKAHWGLLTGFLVLSNQLPETHEHFDPITQGNWERILETFDSSKMLVLGRQSKSLVLGDSLSYFVNLIQ